MEFETLAIKISDLPKEISVSVAESLTDEQLLEVLQDLRGQIIYNSRHEEQAEPLPDVTVTVLEKSQSTVVLRASI
ncbi:hypothetical protein BH10BDE1_BH10BDE1_27990 [soil metagenome]